MNPAPSVLDYEDFRAFLRDVYAHRKASERGFSYAVFARRAGLGYRAHLKLVIDYGQALSPADLEGYVAALRLSGREAEYFRLLVRAGQMKDPAEREAAFARIRGWRFRHGVKELSTQETAGLQASWARVLLLALTRIRGFRPDPAWIRRKLEGRVSLEEAREALAFLQKQGYLRIRGGRLVHTAAGTLHGRSHDGLPGGTTVRRLVVEEALRDRPRPCESVLAFSVLRPEEALSLHHKYVEWLSANLPRRKGKAEGGLCVALWEVVPLSG